MNKERTFVYIDGFNMYYGCCKGTPYRWVDPLSLCQKLLRPHQEIEKIWYFSAEVKPRPNDGDILGRQRAFMRALRTLPNLEIELGMFLEKPTRMALTDPNARPRVVEVLKTEEKGSDVNLATRMLVDAFEDNYDCAVLITNDSDLLGPIKVVREKFGKKVGLLNPQKRPSVILKQNVDFYKKIRGGPLSASQFDDQLTDGQGTFHKPREWS